jgi:hypothetical protein
MPRCQEFASFCRHLKLAPFPAYSKKKILLFKILMKPLKEPFIINLEVFCTCPLPSNNKYRTRSSPIYFNYSLSVTRIKYWYPIGPRIFIIQYWNTAQILIYIQGSPNQGKWMKFSTDFYFNGTRTTIFLNFDLYTIYRHKEFNTLLRESLIQQDMQQVPCVDFYSVTKNLRKGVISSASTLTFRRGSMEFFHHRFLWK